MKHLHINTKRLQSEEVVSTFAPTEAASACSEFGHDDPHRARTVSRWTRIRRAVRTWWLGHFAKP
jgi:hypothetical protein